MKQVKLLPARTLMFRETLTSTMNRLGGRLWVRGPKGQRGEWGNGATRKRVRELARQMARDEMRNARGVTNA